MPRRTRSPAVAIGALVAILVASVDIGWLIAGRLSRPAQHPLLEQTQSGEPTYDAPDATDVVTRSQTPPVPLAPPASVAPPAITGPTSPALTPPRQRPLPSTFVPPEGPATHPAATAPPHSPQPEVRPSADRRGQAPPKRTAALTLKPYVPLATVTAGEDALPPEGTSWRELVASRNRFAARSQERADIEWVLDVGRLAAAPNAPRGRRATAR